MDDHHIIGIHITDRLKKAGAVQDCLTRYGCSIKTRLGLHEASAEVCSPSGIIILEAVGPEVEALLADLAAIEGIEVQRMQFSH